ncbi:hypothetical protein OAQ42_03955 [Flavobacteriaceae bacterium]|jgi:hypothetical protein|nr:hypothetical protein [Flavobacteriaceae bacterium]MDC0917038.1 hypothetical protein [Flavobacteriaceae bacterium]MDC3330103.1 hypothetical protein [Flavobacteriaceae bacterium]
MNILIYAVSIFLSWHPVDWTPYFENKKIEVSFTTTLCEDHQNGVSLEYYLIRVKNKTDETLVVNFYLGDLDDKSEENKVAFVLNPLEIKTGSCDYQPVKLRLFRSESSKKGKGNTTLFNLNTITTVEVY